MPRLPTAFDLPDEISSPVAAPFPDTGAQAIGRGVANIGGAVQQVGGEIQQRQDHAEMLDAEAKRANGIESTVADFQRDPDYKTFAPRFFDAAAKVNSDAAENISSPAAKQLFLIRANQEMHGAYRRVETRATQLAREDQFVTTDNAIGATLGELRDPNTTPERALQIISNADDEISGAQKTGLLSRLHAQHLRDKHLTGTNSTLYRLATQRLWDDPYGTLKDLGAVSTSPKSDTDTPSHLGAQPGSQGDLSRSLSTSPVSPDDEQPQETTLPQKYGDAVKQFEGDPNDRNFYKASWDYKQHSIGYGTRAKYAGEVIDRPEAERRFNDEFYGGAYPKVDEFAPDAPTGVKAALTSLTFNAGTGWMKSGLGKAIKEGDYDKARRIFLTYNRAGGTVNAGLAGRRLKEAQWFNDKDEDTGTPAQPSSMDVAGMEGTDTSTSSGGRIPISAAEQMRLGGPTDTEGEDGNKLEPDQATVQRGELPDVGQQPDQGDQFPKIAGQKSGWADVYKRLSPQAVEHLITNAKTAMHGQLQDELKGAAEYAERYGELPKGDDGLTVRDHMARILTPNQVKKGNMALDAAISRYHAVDGMSDMSPEDADKRIADLDPDKVTQDAKDKGLPPPSYAQAAKTQAYAWKHEQALREWSAKDPAAFVEGGAMKGPASEDGAETAHNIPAAPEVKQVRDFLKSRSAALDPNDPNAQQTIEENLIYARLAAQTRRGIQPDTYDDKGQMVSRGEQRAITMKEATSLLKFHPGMTDEEISNAVTAAKNDADAHYGRYSQRVMRDAVDLVVKGHQAHEAAVGTIGPLLAGRLPYSGWTPQNWRFGARPAAQDAGPPTIGAVNAGRDDIYGAGPAGQANQAKPAPSDAQKDWLRNKVEGESSADPAARASAAAARAAWDSIYSPGASDRDAPRKKK